MQFSLSLVPVWQYCYAAVNITVVNRRFYSMNEIIDEQNWLFIPNQWMKRFTLTWWIVINAVKDKAGDEHKSNPI